MIKKFLILTMALTMMACQDKQKQACEDYIGKSELTLESDLLTPEVLWKMGRVSDVQVSPDGKKALYGVSYYSVEKNASNRELFLLDIATATSKALTHSSKGEYQATWSKDGKYIYYLASNDGKMQLWRMNADGSKATCLSAYEGGIYAYLFSPDETK
ncbi:MAG: PD40 domain-containing protein, partial [Bacteroidales bacterium]|nr:PD40 domain-containing protein [Bacteroidales bacterium]